MTSYEQIWEVAEDHFGIITFSEIADLGISKQNVSSMVRNGRLEKTGHGVYRVKHHVPGEDDVYAAGVAAVGESGYLRGASVIALLNLAPTNPGIIYVGAKQRVRRRLPKGYALKDRRDCETTFYRGIRCQRVREALRDALNEGAVEADRIADAAEKAKEEGFISNEEAAEFKSQS